MDVDAFLKIFGSFTIADVVGVILAGGFLILCYRKVRDYLIKKYKSSEEQNQKIQDALDAVHKYPEYRKQSLEIQERLEKQITEIRVAQDDSNEHIKRLEENIRERERNKSRDRLLQSYKYYASEDKNPMKAWTRMEEEAFSEMFRDYERDGGNGYMHSEVLPVMKSLQIIEMTEAERITELMKSRT